MESPLLTTREACEYLRMGRDALDEARQTGQIAFIQHRRNGTVYFKQEHLDAFLARNTHRAAPIGVTRQTYRKPRKQEVQRV